MSKDIKKWADPAMFLAEEVTPEPSVQLLSCTPDPLGTIAATAHAYQGKFHSSLAEITDDDRRFYINDVRKNVLGAPLEFVNFHFRISGVTRGFTHQMVRQRHAGYAQESMRFAVKETMPVAYPPSLIGTMSWPQWLHVRTKEIFPLWDGDGGSLTEEQSANALEYAERLAPKPQLWRREWDNAVGNLEATYNWLVNDGMPAEDARGLTPTNVLTQLNYTTSLRSLIDHAGLRLCTQAQFEWRQVWTQIVQAIKEYGQSQWYHNHTQGEYVGDAQYADKATSAAWQFEVIADLFRPVCYKTGKCQFMSDFDRVCSIRERVNDNAEIGRGSENWGHDYDNGKVFIPAIHPAEWLLDPNAAKPRG